MKKLILLLLLLVITSNASQWEILIPTVSKHNHNTDRWGEIYNSKHLGLGVRYIKNKDSDFYVSNSTIFLIDSYKSPMITNTLGFNYDIYKNLTVGIETGIGCKKIKFVVHNILANTHYEYRIIPIGATTASYSYKKISIKLLHTPSISHNGMYAEGVTLLLFGIKI